MESLTFFLLATISAAFLPAATAKMKCDFEWSEVPTGVMSMEPSCMQKMTRLIHTEFTAAMTYVAMGAHFSRYDVNRPGFANFFFVRASEKRERATKITSYLQMRTDPEAYLSDLIDNPEPVKTHWDNASEAFMDSLKMETDIAKQIHGIIMNCEKSEDSGLVDYNLVDILSGDLLEEQHKYQRQLAGMISTLNKMTGSQGFMGEYLFDQKLMSNDSF